MTDYFPRDALVRRINNEPTVGLLAGRALLLQLAHPLVARGVEEHSDFRAHPLRRLQATLEAMYSIVNGSTELAEAIGRRIRWIHGFVAGANAPENLMWVHATLVDSALLAHTMFMGKLSAAQEETFYQEMKRVAEPLGLAAAVQPSTFSDFRRYFDHTVETLAVSPTGRELMGAVIHPALPGRLEVPLAPVLAVARLITVGTTPVPIRVQAGLVWDSHRQHALECCQATIRAAVRWQPRPLWALPGRLGGQLVLRQAHHHLATFSSTVAGQEAPVGRAPALARVPSRSR